MTTITFDAAAFRALFAPAFDSTVTYPTPLLQLYFNLGTTIVTNQDSACYALNGDARAEALNLLVAHMATLFTQINAGEVPSLETSATIDRISVTVQPPPATTQFAWWLGLTGYGQILLAILQVSMIGGDYIGGLPERFGFRRVGGGFGGAFG